MFPSSQMNKCMCRQLVLVTVAVSAFLAPHSVGAQASDSLPFRPRQWATEFALGSSFSSVGLVRFLSARRALLLDFGGSVERESANRSTNQHSATNRTDLRLRVGPRWYRPLAPRVARYIAAGLATTMSRVRSNANSVLQAQGYSVEERGTGLGGFGELGALWFVTDHLSLGASWNASLVFRRSTEERQVDSRAPQPQLFRTRVNGTRLDFGQIAVRGALYF